MLKVNNLSISYGTVEVIKNFNLHLLPKEILGIAGENGSGKTSLCKAIANVLYDAEISGEILLYDKPIHTYSIAQRCTNIGMVLQEPEAQLFLPTVNDELAFALENLCVPRMQMVKSIDYVLQLCGIEHLRHKQVDWLSGGEKQLVAIASVLTMSPKILVADEILSKIDSQNKQKILHILQQFVADGGSVILVSHHKKELDVCNRVLYL